MTRKLGHGSIAPQAPAVLKRRIVKAQNESRFQQALELAKQLEHAEPTPEHRQLLRECYRGRVRQLRTQGQVRDALALLDHLVQQVDTDLAWLGDIAQELARCGEPLRALALLPRFTDPKAQANVLGFAVDAVVQDKKSGKEMLPESLQPQFELVKTAFSQLEAGQDEVVKATLQGIGLQSPFLEWKLLLRGLQAYYGNEDTRALENWSRLNPERLPARLAAPFRLLIDPSYRSSQPPQTQQRLQNQADRLQGSSLTVPLRSLQAALTDEDLKGAFRIADGLLSALRQESPKLVHRLAGCFVHAIIEVGQPQDLPRYRRLFGTPSDDPEQHRVSALAMEHRHDLVGAHAYWKAYEKSLAARPESWPAGQADRVRALIWCRMAKHAAHAEYANATYQEPGPPFDPAAEECFQRSLALAPDSLETHEALVVYHLDMANQGKAQKAALQLLKQFPEHGPTLERLGKLFADKKDNALAIEHYHRASQVNPLNRQLRERITILQVEVAREQVAEGKLDPAQALLREIAATGTYPNPWLVDCLAAAAEWKAGQPEQAEEWLGRAAQHGGHPLSIALAMLVECQQTKLAPALKKRFEKAFKEEVTGPASLENAAQALSLAADLAANGVKYLGQKTHQKSLLKYFAKIVDSPHETLLTKALEAIFRLGEYKELRKHAKLCKCQFPNNPHFPLLEIDSYLNSKPKSRDVFYIEMAMLDLRSLINRLPAESQSEWLEEFKQREMKIGPLRPFGGLAQFMGRMFDAGNDDDFWE